MKVPSFGIFYRIFRHFLVSRCTPGLRQIKWTPLFLGIKYWSSSHRLFVNLSWFEQLTKLPVFPRWKCCFCCKKVTAPPTIWFVMLTFSFLSDFLSIKQNVTFYVLIECYHHRLDIESSAITSKMKCYYSKISNQILINIFKHHLLYSLDGKLNVLA